MALWDFTNAEDVAKWDERKNVDVIQRDGKAFVVGTGDDSQMVVRLDNEAAGQLVIELKAEPDKSPTSQVFRATPCRGFKGTQQSKRALTATEQMNSHLICIRGEGAVKKSRFGPFAIYDEHANNGEMQIEPISVYHTEVNK